MSDCIKRIVEKSGGALDARSAKELLKQIDLEARRMAREGFDYDDALQQIVRQRKENTRINLEKQKLNTARNVVIKGRTKAKMTRLIEQGLSLKDAFRAELEGVNSPLKDARASLDVAKEAVASAYFSRMVGTLNREGLLSLLNSKTLNREIGKELWALSLGESGVTQNKQARRIAEIIHETRDSQRRRLNRAGADIGEVGGNVMPQRHDAVAMVKAGEREWVGFMLPLVDDTRTFGGDYGDLAEALGAAYRAMVTGIRLDDRTVRDSKLFQFTGPANLGRKLSQARQIHFKDYDSWEKWNNAFGMRDLNEGIIDAVRFDSHNIALMERYGTNPEAMLRAVADEMKETYRNKAAAEGEQGVAAKIDELIAGAMDKNHIPAHASLARVGSNIRVFNNLTQLGGVLLSSITDIPMKALEYHFQGKSWLTSTVQPFLDLAQGFKSKKDRIEFASLVGAGMENFVSDIGARFSTQDDLGRKAGKVQRLFFKLNGLAWWTDAHKGAMGRVMAHDLGLKAGATFEKLDADTKRLLGNYGISAADWDDLRSTATKLEDGRVYLLADNVTPTHLREKLIGYFIDRINTGVITPMARERRITTLGTQSGTPVGEAVRLMMQFKSFPISMVTRVWGNALWGKGSLDVPAMTYLMLMSGAFGYMAMTAKDFLKGKSPRDPNRLETVYAALAQGGGLGIMGDLLFQDASFGRSAVASAAGPTFGRIDELFKIYSEGIRGGGSKRQAVKTAISYVPFNNLFYTRAALDVMLLQQMMEDLNPGYLRRMESNLKKTYGQHLLYR